MRCVVDRNVVMRRIPVFSIVRRGAFKTHSVPQIELKRVALKYQNKTPYFQSIQRRQHGVKGQGTWWTGRISSRTICFFSSFRFGAVRVGRDEETRSELHCRHAGCGNWVLQLSSVVAERVVTIRLFKSTGEGYVRNVAGGRLGIPGKLHCTRV
jgi:hypothetical protein